jgi:transketolase
VSKAHSDPFGPEEVRLTKQNLGWPLEPTFLIPEPVLAHFRQAIDHGEEAQERWNEDVRRFRRDVPELARSFDTAHDRELPAGWRKALPRFRQGDPELATREASGKVLNALAGEIPWLFGGSADLAPSNKTLIEGSSDFAADNPVGRNLRFGVREHGMGAILNGIARHGGLRPYGGTFLVFSDYMRPPIRLAALMRLPVVYVFTHDSVGLGEDGPTHQPVEHLAALRAVPNLVVIRPADPAETAAAWEVALERGDGPTALALTRQKVPHLERGSAAAGELARGGYVLADLPDASAPPELILIATGSEVHVALEAARRLAADGARTRVVSLPSWELFESQPREHRDAVLPPAVRARVSVEAGSPLGWERYVGSAGAIVGLDRFGASAPGATALERLGFNADNVVGVARRVLDSARTSSARPRGSEAERESPAGHAGAAGANRKASSADGRRAGRDRRSGGNRRRT